jgi:hypothetical protein
MVYAINYYSCYICVNNKSKSNENILVFYLFIYFVVLRIKARALCMLDIHKTYNSPHTPPLYLLQVCR